MPFAIRVRHHLMGDAGRAVARATGFDLSKLVVDGATAVLAVNLIIRPRATKVCADNINNSSTPTNITDSCRVENRAAAGELTARKCPPMPTGIVISRHQGVCAN